MSAIVIKMDAYDFVQLTEQRRTWVTWAGASEPDRYEPIRDGDPAPSMHWKYAYWIGLDWASVLLCRAYLESERQPYQIIVDNSLPPGGYVVLTNWCDAEFTHTCAAQ
ncbi:hypothetical protein [Amycolatopsis sp. NPDC059657]|uniref:hypothetical protein n=1 Tax=Amycolatopsis sp. NPDC059657 TaxID=3346899 RepID=UPI00366BA392